MSAQLRQGYFIVLVNENCNWYFWFKLQNTNYKYQNFECFLVLFLQTLDLQTSIMFSIIAVRPPSTLHTHNSWRKKEIIVYMIYVFLHIYFYTKFLLYSITFLFLWIWNVWVLNRRLCLWIHIAQLWWDDTAIYF